ncbi:hypothetical protein NIES2101_40640 [Calothrix sp. HK-06]|nr:hypothetical protein NIES2101_40640 [Calothrix sp. HK-06]
MSNLLGHSISKEFELLVTCARTSTSDECRYKIKDLLKNDIDWQQFVQMAVTHKVMPLVHTNLNTIARNAVHETVRETFRSLFQTNAQQNLFLTAELLKILALLEANGITAVPYKGPVLASSVYGNLAMRQGGDLDIIVQLPDILKVKQLLLDMGYKRKAELTSVQEIAYFQSKREHTYDFVDYDKDTFIEIHWRITPRFSSPIEPKHFWKYLEPCAFGTKTVNSLPLDYWLPILCVHGSRHCWERLGWICDVAELVRRHDIDWDKTINFASSLGCRRMLFLGLFLANELMGTVLPSFILQQIQAEPKIPTLAAEVGTQLFKPENAKAKFMGTTLYHIQARERWQDKAMYLQSFIDWLVHPDKWNWSKSIEA